MSEWCRYNFDLLDHERISGANLTHFPRTLRETMREAMHALYWRAIVTLQRQRSDDGLISKFALWGPGEARRPIADELLKVGMLEDRGDSYYPRNYLEKNRSGGDIRKAEGAASARQSARRERLRSLVTHTDVTRDTAVTPVCDSLSISDLNIQEGSESQAPPAPPSAESAPPFPQTPPPAPRPIGPAVGGMSPPPADVELDDDLRARCFAAGVRMATKADVAALLDHARDKGRMSADWRAALVAWVRRSPQFERAGNPGFTKPDSPKNATPGAKATAAMLRKRDAMEAAQPDVDIAEMLSKFGT